jgi:dTDP-4-amino-4,6-dideoxygalactose transaminase
LAVLQPRLPSAERLLPYLHTIDATRIYSNHGPLLSAFQERLTRLLALPEDGAICASSGTTAVVGAILATAGRASPERPLALIPAFTFVATAAAVQQCGYELYLVDVDPESWMLDPNALTRHPHLDRAGVVVPVAPFGRPVPQEPWRTFHRLTGVPVVIDGAASFDTILRSPPDYLGDIPLALSFHATKSFGTGEGGAVLCMNADLGRHVERSLNFGFYGSRDCRSASTNGKMSEYSAAVGLAELDEWKAKYSAWSSVMDRYRDAMEAMQLLELLCVHPSISCCYALLVCRTLEEAKGAERDLDRQNIDSRRWYGTGMQGHSYFSASARDMLDVTNDILPRLIGLPVAPDLAETNIQRVVAALRPGLSA